MPDSETGSGRDKFNKILADNFTEDDLNRVRRYVKRILKPHEIPDNLNLYLESYIASARIYFRLLVAAGIYDYLSRGSKFISPHYENLHLATKLIIQLGNGAKHFGDKDYEKATTKASQSALESVGHNLDSLVEAIHNMDFMGDVDPKQTCKSINELFLHYSFQAYTLSLKRLLPYPTTE